MSFNLIANKLVYWSANSSVACGFPSAPLTNNSSQIGKYCDNYPYLFSGDANQLDNELSISLYQRHLRAKKLFSLRNFNLIALSLYVNDYRIFYISSVVSIIFALNINNRFLFIVLFMAFVLLGIECQLLSKVFVYGLNQKYAEIMCILELNYICQDIVDEKLLILEEKKDSVKRRIKKLSKHIYILGKCRQDKSCFFPALSKDIYNKADWLNKPRHTTIKDLYRYLSQLKDCLVKGKIGEIQIEENLLRNDRWKKTSNAIDESFTMTEKLLSLIERFAVVFKKIISFLG